MTRNTTYGFVVCMSSPKKLEFKTWNIRGPKVEGIVVPRGSLSTNLTLEEMKLRIGVSMGES
jgi:hypothetical protein